MKTQNFISRKPGNNALKQRGSVILESLIAILIFSFGVLAIVGLQSASIKNVASAKYRSDASLLANQIIGEMWVSDKTSAAALNANFTNGGAKYTPWVLSVQLALPGVAGANLPTIAINNVQEVTVTIRWQSPGEAVASQHVAIAQIIDNPP